MQLLIARAAVAAIIALSASVGAQNTPVDTKQSEPSPAVLGISVEATQSPKEETSSATFTPEASKSAQTLPQVTGSEEIRQKNRSERIDTLRAYLTKMNSPMVDNTEDFIDAAEQYNLDWRLLPAIAGVESTFGKHVLPGSYNPFGWGGGRIYFDSWRDGIYTVGKGVSEKYVQRGLNTPFKMQPVYAPPSSTWGGKVHNFMVKIAPTENS
jgi:hypothetical protein